MFGIFMLVMGMLLGILLQLGGEIAVEVYRVRKHLKHLREIQAEQLKEAEATTL